MKKDKNTNWADLFNFAPKANIPFPLPFPIMAEYLGEANVSEILKTPLPFLPINTMVMFASLAMPFEFVSEYDLGLLREVRSKNGYFVVATTQSEIEDAEGAKRSSYKCGVLCKLIRILSNEEEATHCIILGIKRIRIQSVDTSKAITFVEAKGYPDIIHKDNEEESAYLKGLIANILELSKKNISHQYDHIPKEIFSNVWESEDPLHMVNFVAQCTALKLPIKQELLECRSLKNRAELLLAYLDKENQLLSIRNEIRSTAKETIEQNQKEFFLRQQINAIQSELGIDGGMDSDLYDLEILAKQKKWNEETAKVFAKELHRLANYNPQSPDYAVQYQYLQTLLDLPWNEYSEDQFNLLRAIKILDRDHFGLEKIKERIIEHLAVLHLKKNLKSPILCLWGPPGVGKTSLGKSIAESLGRKYVRISLGGVHDEAEIRGHRRTYIGAMPGRIIQAIKKAGTANPVVVLDEIDKVSSDYKGDPSSALLEVLDPEQNNAFHDNYIDVDFDLSNVLFIATANTLGTISRPLLDRMELIQVSGYITEEKIEIAKRHLIPQQLEEHGLTKSQVKISNSVLETIIERYTRESGVRSLDKQIAAIMRKVAKKVVAEDSYNISIKQNELKEYLGVAPFSRDVYQGNKYIGVVTGLAWTSVGGEILFIESSLHKGKDCRLTLTGNLGDVMKESAIIALNYIRSHAIELEIDPELFANNELHIHVPEGAIPKDGPSAGITMVTSIVSAFTQRLVRERIAMTGEITLRGKVLPVGGVKEKILAAKRAGIEDILLSSENRKDIEEINEVYTKGITFHYIDDIQQVLDFALLPLHTK